MAKDKAAAVAENGDRKKTECPIKRKHFLEKAGQLTVKIGDQTLYLAPKEMSTGSFGYHASEKAQLVVDGIAVKFQVNILAVAVGSKEQK
jgi:hypothetical protein